MPDNPQTTEDQNSKKKKRKARRELAALLKRLRKLCGQFESAEEWLEFVEQKVFPLADEYQDVLPGDNYQRLKAAARLSEPTRAAANQACKTLQIEIQQVISLIKVFSLPVAVAQFAAGLLIVAAIVAGAAALVLNSMAPRIELTNAGCGPLPLQALGGFNNLPGVDLPNEIPDDGQPHLVRLIPGQIDVDSSQSNELTVRLFGIPLIQGWEIGELVSIRFVEQDLQREILGKNERISLGLDSDYAVILTCN